MNELRRLLRADLGPEPVRCRWCGTWASRRKAPGYRAVIDCGEAACVRETESYTARLLRRAEEISDARLD